MVRDKIDEEALIAIVASLNQFKKSSLKALVRNCDRTYELDDVFTLDELGFTRFPTVMGKIRKDILKERVVSIR